MQKKLVLAEKPSVARDLARVLQCNQKKDGAYEGQNYVVTWALGHLVELSQPEAYHGKYEKWSLEDLPILPSVLKTAVIKKSAKQFSAVKKQMLRNDVGEIIIATDAGREGELVARWILERVSPKKPLKRLWISSVTDRAIQMGFAKLKDAKEYETLYYSAKARAEADWLVGINSTRALTCKYNAQLSCGRVQTPTLYMVEKRDSEIQRFIPQKYFVLKAKISGQWFSVQDQKGVGRFFEEENAKKLEKMLENQICTIQEVSEKESQEYPDRLYDLTSLQADANQQCNLSAKETLFAMQMLYERHKVLTYPRTDSRYLTSDMKKDILDRVKACQIKSYQKVAFQILQSKKQMNPNVYQDDKVSDHHGIVPTEVAPLWAELSSSEKQVYDLVVKRFLSHFQEPARYQKRKVVGKVGSLILKSEEKHLISVGFLEVYGQEKKPVSTQAFQIGQGFPVQEIRMESHFTEPKPAYTDATLLMAMENPTSHLEEENKEYAKTLLETGGLGTVATRTDVIEKLLDTGLLERQKKSIHITNKGKQLLTLVPEDLKSPKLTAKWETKLSEIAKGNLKKELFLTEIREYTTKIIQEIKKEQKNFIHDNRTREKCPNCGKYLLLVEDKRGKRLVCQDRSCGYKKNIAVLTNARCPNCHKRLELYGEGDAKQFRCICGHRESITSFEEKKKERNKQMSKKEVGRFLKNQEEELQNDGFAALLNLQLKK